MSYTIPADAPAAVERAQAKLADVAARLQAVDDRIKQAEASVKTARQQDAQRVCDLALQGKDADNPVEAEHAALAAVDAAKAERAGVHMAVARAAAELIDAIVPLADDWESTLRARLHKAHARYDKAIATATQATAEMKAMRAGIAWLDQNALHPDRPLAHHRDKRTFEPYTGNASLVVDGRPPANSAVTADELLRLASTLTAEPTPPPEPRRLLGETSRFGDSRRAGDPRPNAAGWS